MISGYSNTAWITPAFLAPTGLVVTAISSTAIELAWVDNSSGEDGFLVERKTDGVYTVIGTTTVDAFRDSGLDSDTSYTYRVKAYLAGQFSGYSAEVSIVPGVASALTVKELTGFASSDTSITLSWGEVPDGFPTVDIDLFVSRQWIPSMTVGRDNEAVITGLTAITSYSFRATPSGGDSAGSPSYITLYTAPDAAGYYWGYTVGSVEVDRILTLSGSYPVLRLAVGQTTFGEVDYDADPTGILWAGTITPPTKTASVTPTNPGLYWACSASGASYTGFAVVSGTRPFLRIAYFALDMQTAINDVDPTGYDYGPSVTIPALP